MGVVVRHKRRHKSFTPLTGSRRGIGVLVKQIGVWKKLLMLMLGVSLDG